MAKTKTKRTWTVIYRDDNGKWHRCKPLASRLEALMMRVGFTTTGCHALVHETEHLNIIGMPE